MNLRSRNGVVHYERKTVYVARNVRRDYDDMMDEIRETYPGAVGTVCLMLFQSSNGRATEDAVNCIACLEDPQQIAYVHNWDQLIHLRMEPDVRVEMITINLKVGD